MAHQTSEINTIIRQTEALNWNENPPKLQPVDPDNISSSNPTLVGGSYFSKNYSKTTLIATFQHVWNFIPSFSIEYIEPNNTYLFVFSSVSDQEKKSAIKSLGIWKEILCSSNHGIQNLNQGVSDYLWILLSSDPWSFTAIHYNRECKKMGKFLEIDIAEMKGVHFSKCMRITVEINLLQPLISKIEMERSQCRCNSSMKDYQNFATDVDVRALWKGASVGAIQALFIVLLLQNWKNRLELKWWNRTKLRRTSSCKPVN